MTQGWEALSFQQGAPIYANSPALFNSSELTFFFTPPHWKPATEFHANPVIQWGFWFSGSMKFSSTDGTTVHIGGGDVYFGDDVGSKGHHSENSGYGPAMSAMVQYRGPRGKGPCWPSNISERAVEIFLRNANTK